MRRSRLFVLSLIVAAGLAVAANPLDASDERPDITGTWESKLHLFGESISIEMRTVDGSEYRVTTDIDAFDGLSRSVLKTTGAPLGFSWKRSSGTIVFEGQGRWFGRPSGTFRAVPDPELVARLDADATRSTSPSDLLDFVFADMPTDLLPALWEAGYDDLDVETLRTLGSHRISGDYVRGMQSLGYRPSPDDLVRLRSHGVSVDIVERLSALGLEGIPVDDVITFRRHGVSPDELRGLADAGFPPTDTEAVLQLYRRGLPVDEVTAMRAVPGYDLSSDELVSLHAHGVDPEYFAGLVSDAGIALAVDEIIELRRHGLSVDVVRGYAGAGFVNVDEFTRLHANGVTPDSILEYRSAGLSDAGVDDVIQLQRHGVDPAYVRELRDGGMAELDVDRVVEFHQRGLRGKDLGG